MSERLLAADGLVAAFLLISLERFLHVHLEYLAPCAKCWISSTRCAESTDHLQRELHPPPWWSSRRPVSR